MKTKRRLPETQIQLQQLTDEIRALATRVSDLQASIDRMAAVNELPPYRPLPPQPYEPPTVILYGCQPIGGSVPFGEWYCTRQGK